MDTERRYISFEDAEFRITGGKLGRILKGIALPYLTLGKLPRIFRRRGLRFEQFEPGAFGDLREADVILDMQHERSRPLARTGGGGLELRDDSSSLRLEASLPETRDADDALTLVRSNVLRGLSVEFDPSSVRERVSGNVRTVQEARLLRIGLVDRPAYPTTVEARELPLGGPGDRTAYLWL